jgi:outer membrane receptor protein involved in Fe transport
LPGKFVDDAVKDSSAPINNEIRESYKANSISVFGRRMKLRLLPKFSASFPIKENQVMYFNYGHSTVAPHPSYIYQGLNPYYADRSTLNKVGNPNLNPEVDISYELGLKSQITSNDALNLAAYWKDKYDFITSVSIPIKDVTGRDVYRTIQINGDYARVRGFEAAYIRRIKKWFEGQISASYSVATGQSSSSSESLKEIISSGNRVSVKETPLAWDSPWDIKLYGLFSKNTKQGFFNKKWLNKMSCYADLVYRSGRRYTPYIYQGNEEKTGRPIWVSNTDPTARFSKLGPSNFTLNFNFKKWWQIKKVRVAFTVEITNVLNSKNVLIVNPVTGKAYKYGDAVPTEWKDPQYIDPRDFRSGLLSQGENPSRFVESRHLAIGFNIEF